MIHWIIEKTLDTSVHSVTCPKAFSQQKHWCKITLQLFYAGIQCTEYSRYYVSMSDICELKYLFRSGICWPSLRLGT